MLERFKVPKEDVVRVPERSLRTTVEAVFEKMGVPSDEAAEGADVLVMADLRGVETHGVSNMLRYYVNQYNEGWLREPMFRPRSAVGAQVYLGVGMKGVPAEPERHVRRESG